MSLAPPEDHKVGRDAAASVSSGTSPNGSPVSSPRQRTKPGFFHSLKQKIFAGQHTNEPEYEVGRQHFNQLHEALLRIQTQTKNYMQNIRGLITSSHQVSDEFHLLFTEGNAQHAYVQMIASMNNGHDILASDQVMNPFLEQINTTVIRRLTEELEHHRAIQIRMTDRDAIKADVEYYQTKLDKLKADREKRLSSNKTESASDTAKYERNVTKLNTFVADYRELNTQLVAELHRMWSERQHTLGPIVIDFLNVERQLLTIYGNAVSNIPGPDQAFVHQPYIHNVDQKSGLADVPLNGVSTSHHVPTASIDQTHQQQHAVEIQQPVVGYVQPQQQPQQPQEYAAVPVQQYQAQPPQQAYQPQQEYGVVQVNADTTQQQQVAHPATNPFATSPVSTLPAAVATTATSTAQVYGDQQHVTSIPQTAHVVQQTGTTTTHAQDVNAQSLAAQGYAQQGQAYAQQQVQHGEQYAQQQAQQGQQQVQQVQQDVHAHTQQGQQQAQTYVQQGEQVAQTYTQQGEQAVHSYAQQGQQQVHATQEQVLASSENGIARVVSNPTVQTTATVATSEPVYNTPSGLPVPVQYGESGAVVHQQ